MEIIGRLTADATVRTLKDDREVVQFTIVINDSYKPKDGSEVKKFATFINCSYWLSSRVASYLVKGSMVEVSGRIGVNVYNNMQGEAKGNLIFHVNSLKIHSSKKVIETPRPAAVSESVPTDDLPF
jgi:single-strand DNA-binding protein